MVTEYVPAAIPVIDAVVAELDQAYVNGAVPPETEAVAAPSDNPLQVTSEWVAMEATGPFEMVTLTVFEFISQWVTELETCT